MITTGISEQKCIVLCSVCTVDLSKKVEMRQTLDAQLSENKVVKDELNLVKDSRVYKLIGC